MAFANIFEFQYTLGREYCGLRWHGAMVRLSWGNGLLQWALLLRYSF